MSEKIYCGNAKILTTQYGEMMDVLFHESDIEKMQMEIDNGFVRINISERRAPSDKGWTHTVSINTWKPEADKQKPQNTVNIEHQISGGMDQQSSDTPHGGVETIQIVREDEDDLPF